MSKLYDNFYRISFNHSKDYASRLLLRESDKIYNSRYVSDEHNNHVAFFLRMVRVMRIV
jgi:hypothetical protein